MQEIVDRFGRSTEDVRRWAVNLYNQRAASREDSRYIRARKCTICSIYYDDFGAIYDKRGDGDYGVATPELAEQGFLNAVRFDMKVHNLGEKLDIGVWYTNYGIAAWIVEDHTHIVPSVMEKLLLGALSPREEDKPVDIPVTELPRKLRLPT